MPPNQKNLLKIDWSISNIRGRLFRATRYDGDNIMQLRHRQQPSIHPSERLLLLRVCLVLAVGMLGAGYLYPQPPVDIRKVLDGTLLPDEEVTAFRSSDLLYPSDVVR